MDPQDVVDATETQTFPEEGELGLRVLAQLDPFVHGANDIRFVSQLVCDGLQGANNHTEGSVSISGRGDFRLFADFIKSPFWGRRVQVVSVVDDFCLQWVTFRAHFDVGLVELFQVGEPKLGKP